MSRAGINISYFRFAFLLAIILVGGKSTYAQTEITHRDRKDTLTICVCGDIMMHAGQIANARRNDGSYDFTSCFRLVRDIIGSADISIANMEFTMAGEPFEGYPRFSAPDRIAEDVATAGFDVLLTANNHIFDKGSAGASRTLEVYRRVKAKHGIQIAGLIDNQSNPESDIPLIINKKGIQVSLLNMTYGTNLGADLHWPKTTYISQKATLKKALEKAEDSDLTIALPHWGPEYVLEHSESQENTAVWLAENGADMIIGAHPHVIQDRQSIDLGDRQVSVTYSLGNTLSNMSAKNTQLGLMAWIRIAKDNTGNIEILPTEYTYIWCSRPGGYDNGYTIIPVSRFIGKRDMWLGAWDYDKMMTTLERVMNATEIKDKDIQ